MQESFFYGIESINDTIMSYWPCCYCFNCAYAFGLCTLGLTCIAPYCCISQAYDSADNRVLHLNTKLEAMRGMRWMCSKHLPLKIYTRVLFDMGMSVVT